MRKLFKNILNDVVFGNLVLFFFKNIGFYIFCMYFVLIHVISYTNFHYNWIAQFFVNCIIWFFSLGITVYLEIWTDELFINLDKFGNKIYEKLKKLKDA